MDSMKTSLKLAVMASGRGSNAENIVRVIKEHPQNLQLVAVVTDSPEALVRERLLSLGITVEVFPFARGPGISYQEAKRQHEERFLEYFKQRGVEWVCLAGYMRILSSFFLQQFYDPQLKRNKVINIHPSLLPQFPGKNSYQQAYAQKVKEYGATLHYVDEGVDCGPIIAQTVLQREERESFEGFVQKGLTAEYQLYRNFLGHLALGKGTGVLNP